MKKRSIVWTVFVLTALTSSVGAESEQEAGRSSKVVRFDPASTEYTRLLGGPPETVTMRSGAVVLAPSASVGKHNTEKYEEVVIVLSGTGEMRLGDGTVLTLEPSSVAYCPPGTEHDVTNTGSGPLRYVYVVALAEPK